MSLFTGIFALLGAAAAKLPHRDEGGAYQAIVQQNDSLRRQNEALARALIDRQLDIPLIQTRPIDAATLERMRAALASQRGHVCTCVPARHDVLVGAGLLRGTHPERIIADDPLAP